MNTTRRRLFGFIALPAIPWVDKAAIAAPTPTPEAVAAPAPDPNIIMVNPREVWLSQIVGGWVANAYWAEERDYKQFADPVLNRHIYDETVYISDILALDEEGIRALLTRPWEQMWGGGFSHLDKMQNSLRIHEEDGRLHINANPAKPLYSFDMTTYPGANAAYTKVLPVVKALFATF